MMTDEELLRYSRHILLPGLDIAGQQALQRARVLVVGLGGLGSPVAMYLAASGVGHLTLADYDQVDLSNLQRQVIHTQTSLGENKAVSAKAAIEQLNDTIALEIIEEQLSAPQWQEVIAGIDIVVDCSDNFETRFLLNRLCYHLQKPLVSGAAIRFEGQLTVYDARNPQSPCYQCLYSPEAQEALSCSEAGVISPVVGAIGSLQALETIKLIASVGESLVGRLVLFDAKSHRWRELQLVQDPACPLCAS